MVSDDVVLMLYVLRSLATIVAILLIPVIFYYLGKQDKKVTRLKEKVKYLESTRVPKAESYQILFRQLSLLYLKNNMSIVLNTPDEKDNNNTDYSYIVYFLGIPIRTVVFQHLHKETLRELVDFINLPSDKLKDIYTSTLRDHHEFIKNN